VSDADDLVARWALEKFRKQADRAYEFYVVGPHANRFATSHPTWQKQILGEWHIAHCDATVKPLSHGWECSCYSEYTRDDDWVYECTISCSHDSVDYRAKAYDSWGGLPEILKELIEMDENYCYYESDEYNA
jgi:hypothetical protein